MYGSIIKKPLTMYADKKLKIKMEKIVETWGRRRPILIFQTFIGCIA
jgi:hypothetical protein